MSLVTTAGAVTSLILFVFIGAILGQELASIRVLTSEVVGNALWSLILAPIYIPITIKMYRLTLTAREK
jgi:hypothetical protein